MPRNKGTSRKGKPKKADRAAGMGRALQKAHTGRGRGGGGNLPPKSTGGMAATTTVSIGIEGDHHDTTPKSILELDHLDDFLSQANLAGREFASEKEQFVVLDTHGSEYKAPQQQSQSATSSTIVPSFDFQELSVPRRPEWTSDMTTEQLEQSENMAFLEWRRSIATKEDELFAQQTSDAHVHFHRTVTPFEKNLDVWRQLWRVLERCSCIVQLVDARNPLFYLSQDLRKYATEELGKPMVVIVNKSDYLSQKQRQEWSQYLQETKGWDHVFFSAHVEQQKLDELAQQQRQQEQLGQTNPFQRLDDDDSVEEEENEEKKQEQQSTRPISSTTTTNINNGIDTPLTREELIQWLYDYAVRHHCQVDPRYDNRIQFGMVGFPNVGKSSVINVLVGSTKHAHNIVRVGVASQPGKTKHFQTLYLPDRDDIMLCDCPGLVFPSFVSSTADLLAAGVYPIAQMRDYWSVMELICQRIPRKILSAYYGIQITSLNGDNKYVAQNDYDNVPPTAEEFLSAYCHARSILAASSGQPDYPRAARVIITEYVAGKLLYCHAPPTANVVEFERETMLTAMQNNERKLKSVVVVVEEEEEEKEDVIAAIEEEEEDHPPLTATTPEEEGNDDGRDDEDDDEVDDATAEAGAAADDDWNDNDMLLDIIGGGGGGNSSSSYKQGGKKNNKQQPRGSQKKEHKLKKWRKGKKQRNTDPYGCHSTPDELMLNEVAASGGGNGLMVNAGKHGKRGYTRPTNYAGAKGAAATATTTTVR